MIIVTVLRDKLIHSETIRENQTIKSDQSDDIWWSRFGFNSLWLQSTTSIGPLMHYLPKSKVISSLQSPRQISEKDSSAHQITVLFFLVLLDWIESELTSKPRMTIKKKELYYFLIIFFLKVSFFSSIFNKHLVVMLSLCVWRFVVDQKEKYWANHSWRWASGESMAESFVSGGLQGGGAKSKTNRKKKKSKKEEK